VRPLATVEAAAALSTDTVVIVREGLRPRVTTEVETVTVRLPRASVALPIAARAAVERLLDGTPVRVGDLPGLDEASAVVVARRLLREGIVVLAAP
jgi:hypothetical protein